SPGNPSLVWEKVGVVNLAVDFESKNRRLSGTIDYFEKNGQDLFANTPLDPMTGYLVTYRVNYASLRTRGIDIQLRSRNLAGSVKWDSHFLLSYVRDKVTGFSGEQAALGSYFSTFAMPMEDRPLYTLYSFPFA